MGRSGGSGGRSSGGSSGGSRSSGGRSGGSKRSGGSGGRSSSGLFGGSGSSKGRSEGNKRSSGPVSQNSGGLFGGSRRSERDRRSGSFGGITDGGFFGGSNPRGNIFEPRPERQFPYNFGENQLPPDSEPSRRGCGSTLLFGIIILSIIGFIIAIVSPSLTGSGAEITKSTVQREALSAGSVNVTGYYTDELGWIVNENKLLTGLKHFYQETGVQPYLYITDTVNGSHTPSDSDMDIYANDMYDQLFTDEAHLLFIFFEYDEAYMDRYVCGAQAKTVIDAEAADILLDHIDRYYYDDDLTDEEFFSKAFSDAADRIMTVTRSPWINVLIVFGFVVMLIVLFAWWRYVKKQKSLEAQYNEEILNTPLEVFGSLEAEELAKKYEEFDPNLDQ